MAAAAAGYGRRDPAAAGTGELVDGWGQWRWSYATADAGVVPGGPIRFIFICG